MLFMNPKMSKCINCAVPPRSPLEKLGAIKVLINGGMVREFSTARYFVDGFLPKSDWTIKKQIHLMDACTLGVHAGRNECNGNVREGFCRLAFN